MGIGKCLNCGIRIDDRSDVCSQKCADEYFRYVFDEELKDHPEFDSNIQT